MDNDSILAHYLPACILEGDLCLMISFDADCWTLLRWNPVLWLASAISRKQNKDQVFSSQPIKQVSGGVLYSGCSVCHNHHGGPHARGSVAVAAVALHSDSGDVRLNPGWVSPSDHLFVSRSHVAVEHQMRRVVPPQCPVAPSSAAVGPSWLVSLQRLWQVFSRCPLWVCLQMLLAISPPLASPIIKRSN